MRTLTRRARRAAVAMAGVATVCALTAPAAAAQAGTSYTPSSSEWWMAKWKVPQEVWPVSQGSGVTVAVVDSGVQASNPDLSGVVLSGADELGQPGDGQKDYASGGGHGTTVAALIAGQGTGDAPVGIAPKAKILPVHAIDPGTTSGGVDKGIKYAVDHGAKVINLSLGSATPSATSCDPDEQEAVSYAIKHDVVVVASSGDTNKGDGTSPEEPATCAGVLAVGAVEANGGLWQYSTQGPNVSVAAPGDHITGVWTSGGVSTNASGTSFSAPLVAGAAALIRSKYPSMPWYQVDQRLINTAIPTGSVPNDGTGYGIIDIAHALDVSKYPVRSSAPNPPYTRYQAYLKSSGQSGQGAGANASSASPKSSSGSSVGLIIGIVVGVLVVIAVVVLIIVLVARSRKRRGPRNPGGGGYPPNPYGAPAGQYPPPGQQYPQGQYQPGPYQQQPPPAQPPGQYPPPHQ